MIRYAFIVLFLVSAAPILEGLEVGDSVLRTPITSGDAEIKFTDYHGKSNLIVVSDGLNYAEFNAQLQQRADTFETKYDAAILRLSTGSEIIVIDKSGYVRWKSAADAGLAQSAIGELETELVKLKRDEPLPIGLQAPDFRLADADTGLLVSLSQFKGKKHVLATLLLQTY